MAKNIINEWRFELVTNKNTIDVSKNILRYVNRNSILKINSDFKYKKLIKNKKLLTTNSYLKISKCKDKSWEPLSINKNCEFDLRLGKLNIENPIINIVYFLNADISTCYFKLFMFRVLQALQKKHDNRKEHEQITRECVVLF